VATAIALLLQASSVRYSVCNIATGKTTTTGELVQWAAERAPGFEAQIVADTEADILQDASLREGMWGA
jgi:UDP-glucose 4-epimerase